MCSYLPVFSEERVKAMMPSASATERNSLEFVILVINEENNDLSVPALMGMSNLLVST